jgi:hypothetical protein
VEVGMGSFVNKVLLSQTARMHDIECYQADLLVRFKQAVRERYGKAVRRLASLPSRRKTMGEGERPKTADSGLQGRSHLAGRFFPRAPAYLRVPPCHGGAPLQVLAANLGHADTRMTEKHYAHLAPSYVADVIRATMPRLGMIEPSSVVPLGTDRVPK